MAHEDYKQVTGHWSDQEPVRTSSRWLAGCAWIASLAVAFVAGYVTGEW